MEKGNRTKLKFFDWTWNIGNVEMMSENVDATTNMHDVTATIWKRFYVKVTSQLIQVSFT